MGRKILKVVALLLLFPIIGVTIFLLTFDINNYNGRISSMATQALGRKVSIGKIELKMSLIPTVTLKDIQVANPSWSQKKNLLSIDSMNVSFAVMPLLNGDLQVQKFYINNMIASPEQKNGLNNWTFKKEEKKDVVAKVAAPTKKSTMSIPTISADDIEFKSLNLLYDDGNSVKAILISDVILRQLKAFSASIMYDGQTYKFGGTSDSLLNLAFGKPNFAFQVRLEGLGTTANLSGTIGNTEMFRDIYANLQFEGSDINTVIGAFASNMKFPEEAFKGNVIARGHLDRMTIEKITFGLNGGKSIQLNATAVLDKLKTNPTVELTANLAMPSEKISGIFGIKPFVLNTEVGATKSDVAIKSLSFVAGKSDIEATANIAFIERPIILANIASDYFNINDIVAEKTAEAKIMAVETKKASGKVFSDKKIDLSALNLADLDVVVNMKNIDVDQAVMEPISIEAKVVLDDGVLTASPVNVGVLRGRVNGNVILNTKSTPTAAVSLALSGIQSNALKNIQSIVKDVLINGTVNLKTSGDSVAKMMANLDGDVVAMVPSGTIVSLDFNTLPLPAAVIKSQVPSVMFSTADQVSKIICGVINLPIKKGVVQLKDNIALETSSVNFVVSGNINLGNETMSVSMVPSVSAYGASKLPNQVLSMTQSVKVSGPFVNLQPTLDRQAVASSAAQAGVDLLKKKLGQGTTASSTPKEYAACDKALGKSFPNKPKAAAQTKPVQQKQPVPQIKIPESTKDFKDQLKQNLLESLSQAVVQ